MIESTEPQDVAEVGPTPYSYLFAEEGAAFVKKVTKTVKKEKKKNV
jgi:hypothetical protein